MLEILELLGDVLHGTPAFIAGAIIVLLIVRSVYINVSMSIARSIVTKIPHTKMLREHTSFSMQSLACLSIITPRIGQSTEICFTK